MENKLTSKEELLKELEDKEITIDDIEDQDEDVQIEENQRKLYIEKSDPPIKSLYDDFKDGVLILQPKFQRKYVMKAPTASRLVESILLDVPLPMFYFAEEQDNTVSVIDGQQRLTSIFSFIDAKFLYNNAPFKLTGLKVLKELNGKTYKDLDVSLQRKLKQTPLRVVTIKKESNPDLKFEIFERLNTGATPLNEDEIRNTVYRGKFIDLLAELEEDKTFNELVNKPNFKNRMLYRGMILRFFAFYERTYLNYKPSMKQFCNSFLNENRNLSEEKVERFKTVFKDTLSIVFSVFNDCAFRRFAKDEKSNNFNWIKTRINMALFDIQMWGFTRYRKEQIYPHLEEIKEAMIELMTSDQKFIDSIQLKTSNTDMVDYRFKTWQNKLETIITKKSDARIFPYSVKEKLYKEDPTCKLCNQHIACIDDAHVDHILPYSKSGETCIDNAQITHRWCNQHKSNN